MPRPNQERSRQEQYKDPKKVCYVATEDSKTGAYQYFDELSQTDIYRFLKKYAFKIGLIPSMDGKSAPKHVLENIKDKMTSLEHEGFDRTEDKFWIVCDVDHWKEKSIDAVIEKCESLDIEAAFSNPCSEIWILYHQEKFDNKIYGSSAECKKDAVALLNKRKGYINLLTTMQIDYARNHAEKAHKVKAEKWPKTQGSHIYKLMDYLLGPTP